MVKKSHSPLLSLTFPTIHPVALQLGPIAIHWYGVAYALGLLIGQTMIAPIQRRIQAQFDPAALVTSVMIGIILGGRLGYVLFYDPLYFWEHPFQIPAIWTGGMSFHGGALGAFLAVALSAKRQQQSIIKGLDVLAICATPGLLLGRLANFINGELYGRVTTVWMGMVFPTGGPLPRHPSQLYEAGLEGALLGLILYVMIRRFYAPGRVFFVFVVGYGIARFLVEFTREPDAHLGLLWGQLSMGQWLSIIMIGAGVLWNYVIKKRLY